MSWSKSFADPIELPNGRVLRTLRDAGHYVTGLKGAQRFTNCYEANLATPRRKAFSLILINGLRTRVESKFACLVDSTSQLSDGSWVRRYGAAPTFIASAA